MKTEHDTVCNQPWIVPSRKLSVRFDDVNLFGSNRLTHHYSAVAAATATATGRRRETDDDDGI